MPYKNSTGFTACVAVPLDMAAMLEYRTPPSDLWCRQTPGCLRVMMLGVRLSDTMRRERRAEVELYARGEGRLTRMGARYETQAEAPVPG